MTLFVMSCEEDFEIHQSGFKPKVVVNGVFTLNRPWIVNVSMSRSILETQVGSGRVENAEVYVVQRLTGRQIYLNHTQNGNYESNIYLPEPDKQYELVVKVPGHNEVRAISIAPKKATLNIISNVVEEVNFEIKDDQKNFYIWDLVLSNNKNKIDTLNTPSPGGLVKGLGNYNNLSKFLTDLTKPKTNDATSVGFHTSKFLFDHTQFEEEGGTSDPVKKRYIRLLTASKELYEYYKSIENWTAQNKNCSICPSAEIKSNVNNGLGVFAGYNEELREIK
jgi:hypothetical protein